MPTTDKEPRIADTAGFYGLDFSLVYDSTTGCLSRTDGQSTLPGQPWASLSNNELLDYIRKNHKPSDPDSMAVTPLHTWKYQHSVTEHPNLHLVTSHDGHTVHLKPIPVYMLSAEFWRWFAAASGDHNRETYKAALGFMRTWSLLIRYPADFYIAAPMCTGLIPRTVTPLVPNHSGPMPWLQSGEVDVTFEAFVGFISQFAHTRASDEDVAPRYAYGELKLAPNAVSRTLFLKPGEDKNDHVERNKTEKQKETKKKEKKETNKEDEETQKLIVTYWLASLTFLQISLFCYIVPWYWEAAASWAMVGLGAYGVVLGCWALVSLYFICVRTFDMCRREKTKAAETQEDLPDDEETGENKQLLDDEGNIV
ncbi:hypothetical protein PGQ11_011070 [Apiospora arundinis]|uniref:Uncharacterized protein n=1 Tax=Apiospora arundinis TaxID=335852 RepID=A0ABR2HYI2_9PEZI